MVCGTLQTVFDQNPLFELLTGTIQNQGCKERAEKIELLMNFDAELTFKFTKYKAFSPFCCGFHCWVFKMWSFLGNPPSRCDHL